MKTSCGGPLEERSCPVLDCDEMIGEAHGILNASNRQKTFCTIEFKLMRLGDVEAFLIYPSKGQFGCFQLWCLRRWLNRPGWSSMALLVVSYCIFTSLFHLHLPFAFSHVIYVFICLLHLQLKVQLATGVAPWLQGGELHHPRPPCSAAQRACSGGSSGNFGNFGKAYLVFSDL